MLYPVRFKLQDFSKPLIGIASAWSMVTPCNMDLDQLAGEAEAGANAAGCARNGASKAWRFSRGFLEIMIGRENLGMLPALAQTAERQETSL